MKRVKVQIKWLAIIFTAGIGLTLLMYIFVIVKGKTEISRYTTQLKNYKNVYQNFQENEKAVTVFRATVDSLTQLKDSLERRIVAANNIPFVLEQTARVFQKNHVTVLAGQPEFNQQEKNSDSLLIQFPISWKVRGSFLSIMKSFEAFEELPIAQWVQSIYAVKPPKHPGKLQVEFKSTIWVKGEKK